MSSLDGCACRAINDSTITDGLLDRFRLDAHDFTTMGGMRFRVDSVGDIAGISALVPLAMELARFGDPEPFEVSSIVI